MSIKVFLPAEGSRIHVAFRIVLVPKISKVFVCFSVVFLVIL